MLVSRNTIGLLALAVVAIALVVVSGPMRVQGEAQPAAEEPTPPTDALRTDTEATPLDSAEEASDPPPPSAGEEDRGADASKPELRLWDTSIFENRELLKKAFKKSFENPETTETYSVPTALHDSFQQIFEGLQKDPYGPRLPFESRWHSDGTVQVMAPKMSQELFFAQVIPEFVDYMKKPIVPPSTSDTTTVVYVIPPDQLHLRRFLEDPATRPLFGIVDIAGNAMTVTGTRAQHDKLKAMLPGIVEDRSAIRNPDALTELVQPSSQDDIAHPLAGIAYPSPREGEIAMRAWTELGIKVAPATDAELEATRKQGKRGGLKLVDFDHFPTLEGPVILTEIRSPALSRGIVEFSDLEKVLDAIAKDQPKEIILNGNIGNATFDYALALPSSAAETTAKLPFLSLEDQKIADRAYKLLGVELEPLTQEELAIIAHHGFKSGLRVANMRRESGLIGGDLLVGLHVWPTTDLQAVDAILSRDDLAQLDPLKYYVVRHPTAESGFGGLVVGGPPEKLPAESYSVRSGRISLAVPKPAKATEGSKEAAETGDPYGPRNVPRAPDPIPTPAPPTMFNPPALIVPSTASPPPATYSAPKPPSDQPRDPDSPKVRSSAALPWTPPTEAPQPTPAQAPREGHGATAWPRTPDWDPQWPTQSQAPATPPTPSNAVPVTSPYGVPSASYTTAIGPPVYRYDGKTFEQWRDLWKHELSTEKRIEAVKALAAFARAGHAKEAAETILDVAAGADGELENEIAKVLTSEKVDSAVWFPMLIERFNNDPEKWQQLLEHCLRGLRRIDEAHVQKIVELTQHDEPGVRRAALGALFHIDNNSFQVRVVDALTDPNSEVVTTALQYLALNETRRADEFTDQDAEVEKRPFPIDSLITLLYQEDAKLQRAALSILRPIATRQGDKVAARLIEILNDEARVDDRLTSIRLLGVIGESASAAAPRLLQIITDSDDPRLRVAAAVALDQIEKKAQGRALLLDGVLGDEQAALIEQMNAEHRAVHSLPSPRR